MRIYNENDGKLTREELIDRISDIVIDARAKLERLKDDDSDTAYFLSIEFEEAIEKFDGIADYLNGIYDEVITCLNN